MAQGDFYAYCICPVPQACCQSQCVAGPEGGRAGPVQKVLTSARSVSSPLGMATLQSRQITSLFLCSGMKQELS